MKTRIFHLIAIAVISLATAIATAEPDTSSAITTEEEFSHFLHHYYEEPRPELVASAMDFLSESQVLYNPQAVGPAIAFFALVFARHPERLESWQPVIDRQPDWEKKGLTLALEYAAEPNRILAEHPLVPGRNDVCWAAFFATGDRVWVDEVIAQLAYIDRRDDQNLYLMASSAKWSLSSIVLDHPVVRQAVEDALVDASGAQAEALREVLIDSPETIEQEAVDDVRGMQKSP